MKFLRVPKGSGYWAGIFFIIGIVGLIAAFAFFIFNIMFSAFGLMQMTGGNIIWDFSNPYTPAFHVISGGKVGLIMAILGGLLASISEGRLWIVPTKDKGQKSMMERKNLFIFFSVVFVLYDILSSFYFINDGFGFDPTVTWFPALMIYLIKLGATILLFSIGPEMFMVWGFETMAENHEEGIPSVMLGIGIIIALFKGIGSSIWNAIFGDADDDETENIKKSFSPDKKERGRGRPRSADFISDESNI